MGSSPQGINSLGRETEGCGASITDPSENTRLQSTWVSTNSCGHSAYEKLGEEASDGMMVISAAKQQRGLTSHIQTAANWQHSHSRQSSVKGGAASLKLILSSFCLHSQ